MGPTAAGDDKTTGRLGVFALGAAVALALGAAAGLELRAGPAEAGTFVGPRIVVENPSAPSGEAPAATG